MQFSEETLMAYADGEVDADTRRQIDAALAIDPSLAGRIEKHRALRSELGAAFGGVLDEPVPSHLLEAANTSPAGKVSATISSLDAARAAKRNTSQTKKHWTVREWGAIAATLVIGVLAGRATMRPAGLFATQDGAIVAVGELSAALDDQLTGATDNDAIHIGVSFQSKDGGKFCRSFTTSLAAGFACNEAGKWYVNTLSERQTVQSGEYRMAGSETPAAIVTAIEDVMAGEPLDQEQEQAARQRHWQQ